MRRKLKEYGEVTLNLEDWDGRIDLGRVFGRSDVVHVEIGCGKGGFLVSQAKAEPEALFLGVERAKKYYRYAVDRVGRWGLGNVRVARTEVSELLGRHLGEESVDWYHIYFPDPWPKRRHHKRRFVCGENVAHMIRTLRPGGRVQVVTDYRDYFEEIKALFAANRRVLEPVQFVTAAGAVAGECVGTNYERKYLRQGREIFKLAVRKI